jgi:hypothetical protein
MVFRLVHDQGINFHKKLVKRKKYSLILLILFYFLNNIPAYGQQPLPRESGFAGYIEILGAYTSTNSQLNADRQNEQTDSLDKSGDRVGIFRPFPLGLISYTFADIRTQLYFGILPENVAQGQILFEAGVRHDLKNGTSLLASVIPISPIDRETWEDPFVVGQDRDRTDIDTWGLRLAADNIMGSGFNLRGGFLRQQVKNERSGEFLLLQPASLLTLDDLDDLDRDSYNYRLTAQYSFRLASRLRLLSILRYTRGDAEGDANSFHGLAPQLSLQYFGNQLQTALNATVNREWYDKSHPVFDKTRKDFNMGLFTILGYKDPFGWKNFRIDWINGAFKQNSNIDFFESSSYLTALGIGYMF